MDLTAVHLPTSDAAVAATFYRDVLGLDVEVDEAVTEVSVGASVLVLDERRGWETGHHFAFNVVSGTLESARVWLRDRVRLLDGEGGDVHEFPSWNARSLYFTDAVGNVVEFIARFDIPSDDRAEFGPDAILGISEIGVVVPDVPDAVDRLRAAFDAPLYDGGGEEFAAVGDPHGLFILVPPVREWYPATGIRAVFADVAVAVGREPLRELADLV